MKKLIILTFLTFFAIMLVAQIHLDVEGDAKIRGKLDMSIGTNNLFIGENTGQNNVNGQNNIFLGVSAGISNTTNNNNNNNTFIGFQAGNKNDDGTSNTFIGINTGFNNISANNNTFIGFQAGLTNGITGGGESNTFIGALSGLSNKAGQNNTFIGFQAGNKNDVQREMQEYKQLLDELIAQRTMLTERGNHELILEKKASLSQNQPNPFYQKTVVNYFIPAHVKAARIQVTAVDGKILGILNLSEKAKGQETIDTTTYPVGTYYYFLALDGQILRLSRC